MRESRDPRVGGVIVINLGTSHYLKLTLEQSSRGNATFFEPLICTFWKILRPYTHAFCTLGHVLALIPAISYTNPTKTIHASSVLPLLPLCKVDTCEV